MHIFDLLTLIQKVMKFIDTRGFKFHILFLSFAFILGVAKPDKFV